MSIIRESSEAPLRWGSVPGDRVVRAAGSLALDTLIGLTPTSQVVLIHVNDVRAREPTTKLADDGVVVVADRQQSLALVGFRGGSWRVFDLRTLKWGGSRGRDDVQPTAAALCAQAELAAVGYETGMFSLSDLRRDHDSLLRHGNDRIGSIALGPSGHVVLIASVDGRVSCWQVAPALRKWSYQADEPETPVLVAISGGGDGLDMWIGTGNTIQRHDPETGRLSATYDIGHEHVLFALCDVPNLNQLAIGTLKGSVLFVNKSTGLIHRVVNLAE